MGHRGGVSDSSLCVSGVLSSIVGMCTIMPTDIYTFIYVVHCCCGLLDVVEDSHSKGLTYDEVVAKELLYQCQCSILTIKF